MFKRNSGKIPIGTEQKTPKELHRNFWRNSERIPGGNAEKIQATILKEGILKKKILEKYRKNSLQKS